MKKLVIMGVLCSILSGCMPKRDCHVIIFRTGGKENDTIEVKTTAYYPHFTLKDWSAYLEVEEPLPIMPWKKRIRKIWVGADQNGYDIIEY